MGSGKSTAANILLNQYGYQRVSVATPMKLLAECARMGALEYAWVLLGSLCSLVPTSVWYESWLHCCERNMAELVSPGATKPRAFLQDLGACFRELDIDVWTNTLVSLVRQARHPLVIDDLRFPGELRAVQQLGWKVARCFCSEATRQQRVLAPYPTMDPRCNDDISETTLDSFFFDYTLVTSDPDTSVLAAQVAAMIRGWGGA